jgi:hypothetical protein
MAASWELDRQITHLVNRILREVSSSGAVKRADGRRLRREIRQVLERDYSASLRNSLEPGDVNRLVATASAIWPNFNRSPMGPPSMRLFAEVSELLSLHLSSAPYRHRGGFAVRGFYLRKTPPALGKPLIYVNSAHHPLAVGTAFCHEVGHHLSAGMFCPGGEQPAARLYLGAECAARLDDRVELAADIIVSLAGYPKPMARQIFAGPVQHGLMPDLAVPSGKVFEAVQQHLRARYGFDLAAVLVPDRKLHYLTGMLHYARLREALLAEYDV